MSKVDPRITAMLEVAQLKYRTDDDGDVIVMVSGWAEGRDQVVYMRSKTFTFDDQEFRDVFSPAHTGDIPPAKVLAYCLKQNDEVAMGSWRLQVNAQSEKTALLFGAHLDANVSPQRLSKILFNIGKVTDDLERKLSDQDKF